MTRGELIANERSRAAWALSFGGEEIFLVVSSAIVFTCTAWPLLAESNARSRVV
jgi:hypothetical protein